MKCRRIKIRGDNWRIVIERPPHNNCVALCSYNNRTIYIRPSSKGKISDAIHEVLHACFPDIEEEAIDETERAIVQAVLLVNSMTKEKLTA